MRQTRSRGGVRAPVWLETLAQDVRFATWSLRRSPGFTIAAVLTLVLGIGSTIAAFSLVRGVLALPFPSPDRLVVLSDATGRNDLALTVSAFREYQEQAQALERPVAARFGSANQSIDGRPTLIGTEEVSAGYFEALGVQPVAGGLPAFDARGVEGTRPALVSYGYWQRQFGGAPDAVGRTIEIRQRTASSTRSDAELVTIVGVLPAWFPGRLSGSIPPVSLWLPLDVDGATQDGQRALTIVGRIRLNQSIEAAQAELDAVAGRLGWGASPRLLPIADRMIGGAARQRVAIITAVMGLMFLIVVLNLLTLNTVRVAQRGRELSIRTAFGAPMWRLVRLCTAEAMLLASAGGGLAVIVAWSIRDVALARIPPFLPGMERIAIDGSAVAFAVAAILMTGMAIGLVPAIQASRAGVRGVLNGSATVDGRSPRLHAALIFAETTLALVLMVAAGLLSYSYSRVAGIDTGFDSAGVVTAEIELPEHARTRPERDALIARLLQEVRAIPGVESAAMTDALPLHGRSSLEALEGDTGHILTIDPSAPVLASLPIIQVVSAGYDAVMRIPLVAGRWLDQHDVASAADVAVVSEPLAARLWPGEQPLGRRLRVTGGRQDGAWLTVVGVSRATRNLQFFGEPSPIVYAPYTSDVYPFAPRRDIALAVRVRPGSPAPIAGTIDRVAPDGLVMMGSMAETVESYLRTPRFHATVLGWLAIAAVFLAALGIYSVVAFSTALRRHEIGVRLALGARARTVALQSTRRGVAPAAAGVVTGVAISFGLSRYLESYLFGVLPTDLRIYAGVCATALLVAGIAAWVPSHRAAGVGPTAALRHGE